MRYRRLDPDGDYTIGSGQSDFYTNQPEAVAQAVGTRLRLEFGSWFLDVTDGTNWQTGVLGNNTTNTRDIILQSRILDTPGINEILSYQSSFDGNTREFSVLVRLSTIYGPIPPGPVRAGAVLKFVLNDPSLGMLGGSGTLG